MIYYNIKLIIFLIILGTTAIIYNNDCKLLYRNMKYKKISCAPTKFRALAELLYEHTERHIHENNKLREYGNIHGKKYKKDKYLNNVVKRKQDVPEVTEKENIGTTNLSIYRKKIYDNEIDAKSNRFSCSLKYLEIERKLYNNFYVKPEMDFEKFSNKSNDKSCECVNRKKTYNILNSSNKFHDNYLDNFKLGCSGVVNTCTFSSAIVAKCGISAASGAAVAEAATKATTLGIAELAGLAEKLTSASIGTKFFCVSSLEPAIKTTATSLYPSVQSSSVLSIAESASSVGIAAFYTYGMTIVALIAVTIIVILLYIWLRKRRKNSWKHECKKHLCK
ncbi:PIR protein, putative [Plasmodium sp. gorilla clade G1]|nr:PIR protein, putative [Plasmodium sp. gorilla clade G1]